MNSAISTSTSPTYHRLYRDSHAQSGRKDQNLHRRKIVTNHDLAIRLSKFQMVVKSSREPQVLLKNRIQGFSWSLIRIWGVDERSEQGGYPLVYIYISLYYIVVSINLPLTPASSAPLPLLFPSLTPPHLFLFPSSSLPLPLLISSSLFLSCSPSSSLPHLLLIASSSLPHSLLIPF